MTSLTMYVEYVILTNKNPNETNKIKSHLDFVLSIKGLGYLTTSLE